MGVIADARMQHHYQTCRDESCERFACRVYREGYNDGHAAGYAAGEAAGYSSAHADGYAAASCGEVG